MNNYNVVAQVYNIITIIIVCEIVLFFAASRSMINIIEEMGVVVVIAMKRFHLFSVTQELRNSYI